jgi:holo-[acyl-carrier protein] synthase
VIFGIGTDAVKLSRVERIWAHYGDRFARRILMDEEYELLRPQHRPVRFLAMRFAAKEAIVKAMGTGFANGMWVRDTGTIPNPLGQPQVIFSLRGLRKCDELGISGGHLSLTDEDDLVIAVAVLMKAGAASS